MDHVQVNGLREPRRFTSKQERKRWMKENGYREFVRHKGTDSDKSKHTTNWAASMSPETLENARIMLERTASEPARTNPDDEAADVRVSRTYYGDVLIDNNGNILGGSPEWEAFRGRR